MLPNGANTGVENRKPIAQKLKAFLKAEGEPSWLASYKFLIFGSYFNILLVFVPLSAISHYLNFDAGLRFGFSFLAIIPLAKVYWNNYLCMT